MPYIIELHQNMATIKVKFRPSTVADREDAIYCQIIHERKVRHLLSDYRVFSYEWDESRSMARTMQKIDRKSYILSIRKRIHWDVERLTKIFRKLEADSIEWTKEMQLILDKYPENASDYLLPIIRNPAQTSVAPTVTSGTILTKI